jgi:hypothetical protein
MGLFYTQQDADGSERYNLLSIVFRCLAGGLSFEV